MPSRLNFKRRTKGNQQFYNSKEWRATRKYFIVDNPLCVECERNGLTVAADVVDHITPINEGGARFDFENLQSLCHRHHNKKSGKEAHG